MVDKAEKEAAAEVKAVEKAEAKVAAAEEKAEEAALEAGGQAWWHDADHGSTAEKNAAQKARDAAAGYGPPVESSD